jgi:hypothetical protein
MGKVESKRTLVTVVSKVRWIPPAGSLDGKSKELIVTPFLRLFMPFSVTCFVERTTPETSIPVSNFRLTIYPGPSTSQLTQSSNYDRPRKPSAKEGEKKKG